MTEEGLVLAELLEKAGERDFLRAVAEGVLQLLMETDVEGLIGAGGSVRISMYIEPFLIVLSPQRAEGSKRSPNRMANCPIAAVHSIGGRQ